MPQLYDNSSDEDEEQLEPSFKVNKGFADKYETKKRTEELSKLQDKYGKDYQFGDLEGESEEDSEDLSDDDEDAEFVTPQVDAAILRTLARIKAKDPAVYEPDRDVFEEEERRTAEAAGNGSTKSKKSASSKPVLLKDYQRSRLLAENPEDDPEFASSSSTPFIPTPAQEQAQLKSEITAAFHADSDSEDDVFQKREQGDDDRLKEERDYEKFLETNVGKKAVKAALGDEDDFLRDYILNRGWLDRENDETHIPSYEEITGDGAEKASKSKKKKGKSRLLDDEEAALKLNPGAHDDDDEEFDDEAEEFEHRYNFRFEEAAGSNLVTHARDAISTVRKPTAVVSARARQREAAKQKKEEEKSARKEEVRRLKALKRKQVEEKLLQLVEAAGGGAEATKFEDLDLDAEWDEKKHEEEMKRIYGEDYEGAQDDGFKPTWDDDIDITDIVGEDGGSDDEDADVHMPFASTSTLPQEEEEEEEPVSSKKSKKDKKKKKEPSSSKRDEEGFPSALLEKAKAAGDHESKKMLERLEDEYYGIEYEDKVGEVKTRFKYTKVAPSSFNLTPEEILLATDAELNAFMSLKKIAPYRMSEADQAKQRKKLKELRDALKNRKWGDEVDETKALEELERRKEKKRKWKSEGKEKDATGANAVAVTAGGDGGGEERPKKKKRAGKSERKRVKGEGVVAAE
ncbi:KRI1 family protein [Sporobolomyces salmoneus]|uniref:KRI1 family protein n=1 Tax=Sporobolomyces salmoneus TaxID=183962 RepID=UPI00317B7E68